MKFIGIALIFIITMIGCEGKSKLFESENIKSITITHHIVSNNKFIIEIHSVDEINKIVDLLNYSRKEPRIFKANYEIKILYNKGLSKLILGNGNMIKVDGLTYKLNQNLNDLIENY